MIVLSSPGRLRFLLLAGCGAFSFILHARSDSTRHAFRFRGFPVVYYTPETRWAGGVAGVSTFYAQYPRDSLYPSSVGVGFVYTQEKQVLAYFPYNLYFRNGKYWMYGELGYYQYYYYFFGTGNANDTGYNEYYGASFARVRLSALMRIKSTRVYTGIKYAFDEIGISGKKDGGILDSDTLTGSRGGRVSGVGWVLNRDTRDHKFYPTRGSMAEFFVFGEDKFTGSSFRYFRITLDASAYFRIYRNHILALHGNAVYINGKVPFTHMGMLGGYRKLRGYYEGRYRDQTLLLMQAEYRCMIAWRIGIAAFGGAGMVAPSPGELTVSYLRISGGGGFRFMLDKKQKINMRIEYAWGKNSNGAYLTIGEAF